MKWLKSEVNQKRFNWLVVVNIFLIYLLIALSNSAKAQDQIGSVNTKGLIFKDKINVVAFDDPGISGVTCYTTQHKKALSLVDSSSVSLACRQTGAINLSNTNNASNVFSTMKGLFFKETVIDRFIDNKRGVIVYLAYTKALGGKNASHSISTVVVRPW